MPMAVVVPHHGGPYRPTIWTDDIAIGILFWSTIFFILAIIIFRKNILNRIRTKQYKEILLIFAIYLILTLPTLGFILLK